MKPGHYSIREDQDDWLRNHAHAQRTTKSALVRVAIEHMREDVVDGGDFLQSLLAKHEGAGS